MDFSAELHEERNKSWSQKRLLSGSFFLRVLEYYILQPSENWFVICRLFGNYPAKECHSYYEPSFDVTLNRWALHVLHKQKYISPKKKPMPYQHFNALRSSRLAYKYFTEKWNQMSPAGAYLVKVRVPVNNSHRKSTQGCPTRWRWKFISDPDPIILLPCHSLTQSLRMCFAKGVLTGTITTMTTETAI